MIIRDFSEGFYDFWKSWDFLDKNHLRKYFLYPAIISIVLFIGYVVGLIFAIPPLTGVIFDWVRLDGDEWWEKVIRWTFRIGVFVGLVFLFLQVYKMVVMIILGPFLAGLAEKVLNLLRQNEKAKNSFRVELQYFFRGLWLNIRNLFLELVFTILMLLLSLIPFVGWIIGPVGLFLVQAYYIGFGYLDFSYEYAGKGVGESVRLTRKHKWYAMGNGAAYSMLLMIPVVGFLVAPTMGVTAAAIGMHRKGVVK